MGLENFLTDSITDLDTYTYTLPQILQMRSRETPGETAYIFLRDGEEEEENITYAELDAAAVLIARQLLAMKMKGERALMLFPPGLEFIKALFGCFYAGVIAVPAYTPKKNRPLDRMIALVADSGLRVVISTDAIARGSKGDFSDVQELKSLPWLTVDSREPADLPDVILPDLPPSSAIALMQYTSGSTGSPKGVMVTHQNFMRNAESWRNCFRLTRQSIAITWLPCFHDLGLNDGILVPMFVGYRGIIMPPVAFLQQPLRWLNAITKYRATHTGGPNFALDHCVNGINKKDIARLDLSSLHSFYCGAEPVRKSTFDHFSETFQPCGFKSHMLQTAYGMAETTLVITTPDRGRGPLSLCLSASALEQDKVIPVNPGDGDARYLVGNGHHWIDTEVKIVHPETSLPCEDDEVGEIWVHGSIVTKGYWNKPELNAEIFEAQIKTQPGKNWLRTGDLGFFNNGDLFITGRLKDLIIIRGSNYYPQDLEFIAEGSHPALRANASAAFTIDVDDQEQLVIVAEVERTALRELNVEEVCDAIRQHISEEFELRVHSIELLRTASIPKTSSGKIQRKACREGFLNQSLYVVGASLPEQPKEEEKTVNIHDQLSMQAWLMAWLHIQLKIPFEKIDNSKPLSVYGLNSMKALQLQQDVLDTYGVNMPPYLFFDNLSLKELITKAWEMINEN